MPAEFAGATRDRAERVAVSLLSQCGDDLRGVSTPHESSTAGRLMALSAVQKAGRNILVGFDSSAVYVDSLRHQQLHGLAVQYPFRMGEPGVKILVDHRTGKSVPKRVDTGATMVTWEIWIGRNPEIVASTRARHLESTRSSEKGFPSGS